MKNGKLRFAAIDIPIVISDLSKTLSKLDSENAYIYNDFCSDLQLVRNGSDFLKKLQFELIKCRECDKTSGVNPESIQRAILGQCKILATDQVRLAKKEKKLLIHLESKLRKGSKGSEKLEKAIEVEDKTIESIEKKISGRLE
ncbi:hypothetical protein [Methyloprofundus sp.]|uniref:hypothetical protein n=1 Tax=Methyloprofundus sp. TaxID=2020875 RepID=UPI003D0C9528